jgi:hypothetical protein
MNPRISFFLLAGLLAVSTACERISPSVSIPGYAEKHEAAAPQAEKKPMGGTENPPSYFPAQSGE